MTFIVSSALPGMGALDLSALGRELGSTAMVTAADAATNTNAYRINRARIAALAHLGYSGLDTYAAAKPGIFLVSLAGLLASGVALAKRRKKCPEAPALYALTAALSGAAAWFTRPDWLLPPPQANVQVDPNAADYVKQALGRIDGRAAALSRSEPGWEARTLGRLWQDLGSGTMPPVVTTLLTKHSQ